MSLDTRPIGRRTVPITIRLVYTIGDGPPSWHGIITNESADKSQAFNVGPVGIGTLMTVVGASLDFLLGYRSSSEIK